MSEPLTKPVLEMYREAIAEKARLREALQMIAAGYPGGSMDSTEVEEWFVGQATAALNQREASPATDEHGER